MVTTLGRSIEDFILGPQLGKGGFATVYSAHSKRSNEEVAIKIIDKESMRSAGILDRVKSEVAIHSKLKHSSVVELLSYFESDKYVYLVLELCHNGELFTYLKQNNLKLNERETACVLFQICTGLMYLHSHSILHRDLSLSNILLTRSYQIKIGDFGLATDISDRMQRHTTICGTLDFMAPEIFSSDSQGFYSDIWSLGCIMYILLTGNSPLENNGLKSAFRKMATCRFVIPNGVSIAAKDLLEMLLKKSPLDRIELSSVIEHPFILRNIQESKPTDTFRVYRDEPERFVPIMPTINQQDNSHLRQYSYQRIPKQPPTPPTRLLPSPQPNRNNLSSNSLPTLPRRDSGPILNHRVHRSDFINSRNRSGFDGRPLFHSNSTDSFHLPSLPPSLHTQSEVSLHTTALPSLIGSKIIEFTPLNTSRLKPISLTLRNVDVELTDKLATILFLYKKGSREVSEIFLISPDGFNVTLFKKTAAKQSSITLPTNEHELYVSSSHPAFKIVSKHTYQELPDKLRKKYLFALEFINI
ncbi:serine/threonine protein kinase [Oopsacas minuta]|uniref:Serine/threonine protein kinase n=1 Tax=Oopsacas minuta TaxID=111878 RepID=A0AAV7K3A2_9METZ|nr:serine/threonine protein kinase [Oopsacas minuta]